MYEHRPPHPHIAGTGEGQATSTQRPLYGENVGMKGKHAAATYVYTTFGFVVCACNWAGRRKSWRRRRRRRRRRRGGTGVVHVDYIRIWHLFVDLRGNGKTYAGSVSNLAQTIDSQCHCHWEDSCTLQIDIRFPHFTI